MERRVGGNHSHKDGSEPKTPKDLPGKEKMKISREKICRGKVSKIFFSLFYRQNLKEQYMN